MSKDLYRKYFLVLILFISQLLNAASAQMLITIKDSETGIPLEGVVIFAPDSRYYSISDGHGQALINLPSEETEVAFRLIGYEQQIITTQELRLAGFTVMLKPSRLALEQVVISATRWNQTTSNIPQKVTSLASKDLQLQNPQTAADMLGTSGEVFIQKSQQGGGSPMIRGFSANRLLYAVDGIRMNTAIFRSGNLQNVISLDALAMESTEILFGPGSVMYGSDAIGAVMSFRTREARYAVDSKTLVSGNVMTRYASANQEKTIHGHLNAGRKKWASITSFTFTDFDDLRMGAHGPDSYLRPFFVERRGNEDIVVDNPEPRLQTPSGYHQTNLMQKFRFKPSENWDIQYAFHFSRLSEYDRYDRLIETRNGLPRSAEWKYGPQKWDLHQLRFVNRRNSGIYDQMVAQIYFQRFEESRINRNFNDEIRNTRTENVDAWGANIDYSKHLNNGSIINYGVEFVLNNVTSSGMGQNIENGSEFTVSSRYPDSRWISLAAYALLQHDLTPTLNLQTGLRFNQFKLESDFSNNSEFIPLPFSESTLNNGSLTGSAGLAYQPTSSFTLRGNLSTGFRAPNVDDIGKIFDSEPGSVVVPNPNLKPEYAYNAEIGASKVFGDFLKLDFTAFYTYLDNAMVRRDFQLNGQDSIEYDGTLSQVQAVQNAASARVYGFQAGFEIKLLQNISISTQLNYQKGEEELEDGSTSPSRHAAPFFGISRITYQRGLMEIQLYSTYAGTRGFNNMPEEEIGKPYLYAEDQDGNPYAPGWYTLNLKGLFNISSRIICTGGIENITNQRYRPYSSGMAGAGINFIASFSYRF
ncbi:TonB-dependent receptor [Fulvivirga sedimenti]|uniref:TonB-dependent receptor n=1 Tax=Fulvivirga sedimenti TaxID=2879465 RepID=A0A9X1HKW6_9BACT|nr:TonB-dependent receptor [Fulvivirga sedimenti]MCA6074053.1 TonB-dependent receptor [Fulvivirga sedimenti]